MNGAPTGRKSSGGWGARLSDAPERLWPDGVVHHGARILFLVLVASLFTWLFPPEPLVSVGRWEIGTVADEEIIARVPFSVPKTAAELERDRTAAAASVPPTFDARPEAADSMTSRLERFFDDVDSARVRGGAQGIRAVLTRAGISASGAQAQALADSATFRAVRSAALRAAREVLPGGVVETSIARDLQTEEVAVRLGEREGYVPAEEIMVPSEFYSRATDLLPDEAAPAVNDLLRLVLIRFLEYTYVPNLVATELDRQAARSSVPTTKSSVLAGEAIVRANQQIGQPELERLEAYETQLRNQGLLEAEQEDQLGPWFGATLLNLCVLLVFGLLVFFFRVEIYRNIRWISLIALLVVVYVLVAAGITRQGWAPTLLPVAFVTLSAAVMFDGRMALVLAMTLGMLTALQPPFDPVFALLTVTLGGAAAALSVRAVRRRSQTWVVFIPIITAAYAVVLLGLATVEGWEAARFFEDLGWSAGNAVFSAIVAMGFVPVFEWYTGITTDQTLLEWADPNRPLLKRLSLEAPGTYAHTINVANLAEAAATAIGADGLLSRVGIYYHDVGKVLKPQYFVENQPGGRNPHDMLKPETSAQIVREHVVEGLRLAREAKLPEKVADFIPEHHGTQRISYFWQKAKDELEEGAELDAEKFSYPGPRPRSKETAIAMLADSVESATRALQDPSPERLRELLDTVVEGKIRDRQLDEAPLTLQEIALVKEQFLKVLGGAYHHRIDYPETRHLTEAPGKEAGAQGQQADADAEKEAPDLDSDPSDEDRR